jgi:hypothetical protein
VLIRRCAWHPRNFGHGKLLGVVGWRVLRIDFTHGICERCAARVAARPGRPDVQPLATLQTGHIAGMVLVALAVITGLVLVARPTNDAPPQTELASALPRSVKVAQVATSESSAPVRLRRPIYGRPASGPHHVRAVRDHQSP